MVKMFLYNVHTPSKTFALVHKDGESQTSLVDRICKKAGLDGDGSTAVKEGKDSAGLVYEYEGEKWSLDDDDDLSILLSRFPPSSTPSVTLQLTPPSSTRHTHFAPPPPSYSTPSSVIKSKAQNSQKKSALKSSSSTASVPSGPTSKDPIEKSVATLPNGDSGSSKDAAGKPGRELGGTDGKKPLPGGGKTAGRAVSLSVPTKEKEVKAAPKAMSVTSTRSRRSKYGGDPDAEPLGVVKRRAWEEFHANNGVRTVVGSVGKVKNVRMLLKSGYTHVYVSRNFAYKAGLVDKKYGMGAAGYTGLKILGNVPITVGSRTATHRVFINEEQHFEVILGREWVEKMGIKVDPIDKTLLHYMDTGEAVACDLVVLKNEKGEVIHVT